MAGSATWYWTVSLTGWHVGLLASGIGALIGFAITLGGGYGRLHACCAAVLVLLTIITGAHRYYEVSVSTTGSATAQAAQPGLGVWMAIRRDARRWVDLGDNPSPERIRAFASRHQYSWESAREFARTVGTQLREFAERNPTYERWLAEGPAVPRPEIQPAWSNRPKGFPEFVFSAFNLLDFLAWFVGVYIACKIVQRATIRRDVRRA